MRNFFLLLITIFISNLIFAQQYNFRNFSLEQGLPQSTIYCIAQDNNNFLWLGTEGGGLVRFNGKEFKTYTKKNGLASNIVRSILIDKNNNIWVGTDNGINILNGYTVKTINKDNNLSGNTILKLYQDKDLNIWAATNDGGINKISIKNDSISIKSYTTNNGLPTNFVFDIYQDKNSNIWLAQYGGLTKLTFKNDSLIDVKNITSFEGLPSDIILNITADKNGNLWCGTYDNGAFKYYTTNKDSGKIEIFNKSNYLNSNRIWDILIDNNNIWFATDDNGVDKFNLKTKYTKYFTTDKSFPNKQVLSIYKDNDNNIWFGTMGSGLCMSLGEEFIHYSKHEGISSQVFAIKQDKYKNLWIGTNGQGLINAKLINDSLTLKYYTTDNGLPDNSIRAIAIAPNNNIWLGTAENGISRFINGKFINYTKTEEQNSLINNNINTIYVDKIGLVWIGTQGGISLFDGEKFISIDENTGLINNEVQTIIEDKNKNIWVGTWNGLAKIKGNSMTDYDEKEGLFDKKVYALAEDLHGNIWIGTFGGGLYKFDTHTKDTIPIKLFANDSILSSNNIYSLKFYNDYTLIIGTDKGIDKIFLNKNQEIINIQSYGKLEGLKYIENSLNALEKDNNGNLWFGTTMGLTKFNIKLQKKSQNKPKLLLTDLRLFFEKVNWKDYAKNVNPWFNLPKNLQLKYNKNHLQFIFNGIDYNNPQKLQYSYYLEGLDKKYSPYTNRNEIVFSSLPPGDYIFHVKAKNNFGIESSPVDFKFKITPPWYKTLWAEISGVIIIILLIFFFIKFRERKLKHDKQVLENTVQERTQEIKKQKEHIEEIHQEITDSIHYAQKIQHSVLPNDKYLNEILPENFILFKPKDIVSGDFYWAAQIKNNDILKTIVCAADCTGHGVPGGFMSMLGISFLNDIVKERNFKNSGDILNTLRQNIIEALQQKGKTGEQKDGMDLSLCIIEEKNNKIHFEYSGANNPVYLTVNNNFFTNNNIDNNKKIKHEKINNINFIEIKADKMPIAIYDKMNDFETTKLILEKNDSFYLFSDGYADQFGGPKGKKLKYKTFKNLICSFQDKALSEQKTALDNKIEEWKNFIDPYTNNTYTQIDDIIVIGIKL